MLNIKRSTYQTYGVTCLHLAAKYEEIYPPYLQDFTMMTNGACTKKDVIQLEIKILMTLDFDIYFPTSLRFLERYCVLAKCSIEIYNLSRFMLEICMISVEMNKFNPSITAGSAIYTSLKFNQLYNLWPQNK